MRSIDISWTTLQQVNQFSYFRSMVTSNGKRNFEINEELASKRPPSQSWPICSFSVKKETRWRLTWYIWSTLLYLCETWAISQTMPKRLESAKMWCQPIIWKIPWTDMVSNEKDLERAETSISLLWPMISRQTTFLGHHYVEERVSCTTDSNRKDKD